MRKRMIPGLVAAFFVVTTHIFADTIPVSGGGDAIQNAINAAGAGDILVVAPGTYNSINFNGKNITVVSSNPEDANIVANTIIDANGVGSTVTFANGEGPNAVLTGFTVTGGYGTGVSYFYWGAGIYCQSASPTISRNVITGNHGPVEWGGDDPENWRIGYGGGIGCAESGAVISNNIISGNDAYAGGGVAVFRGDTKIVSNLISDNSAVQGGGVFSSDCDGPISNCTITGNLGDLAGGLRGGGLVVNCAITGNSAFTTGGVRDCDGPIRNCVIADNSAADEGAGLSYCWGPVSNCTITGNQADWGGGLYECHGPVSNCIIWGNQPCQLSDSSTPTHSCVQGGVDGIGNISDDPLFANPDAGDYHLQVYSRCINAGDPGFVAEPNETDIDSEVRVFEGRVDMGADEYVGHLMPIADAGPDQYLKQIQLVILDGSGSYFYDANDLKEFQWAQVGGANVVLNDCNAIEPAFMPEAEGEYRFELVVNDALYASYPDEVLIVVGNRPPVGDAGSDILCQVGEQVSLDGSDSYDPDAVDELSYTWTQLQGPNVALFDANSATPYFDCNEWALYEFQLIVSDGLEDSQPAIVEVATVDVNINEQNLDVGYDIAPDYYYNYPDISGNRVVYGVGWACPLSWDLKCKDMSTGHVYVFEGGGIHAQPEIEGDLIVHFGAKSQDEPFRISAYDRSSISYYHIPSLEPETLRGYTATESYSHPAISGTKVVWLEHLNLDPSGAPGYNLPYNICGADVTTIDDPEFFTIATDVGSRDVTLNAIYEFDNVVDICGNMVVWEGDGDIYGADISDLNDIKVFPICTHPARQFDPAISGNIVVWTDERNDGGDIYGAYIYDTENIEAFEIVGAGGRQEQAAIEGRMIVYVDFIHPIEGNIGEIKVCYLTRRHGAMEVPLAQPRYGVGPAMDGSSIVWMGEDDYYGRAEGISLEIAYSIADGPIHNLTAAKRYDYFQHAICQAESGDEIVAGPGTYHEDFDFKGKSVRLSSADPNDPNVVAATVLHGNNHGPVVTFSGGEGASCVLSGFTITDGNEGIYCSGASPTITNCRIVGNKDAGIESWYVAGWRRSPTVINCTIAGNEGAGVMARGRKTPTIINCIIAGNKKAGIDGDDNQIVTNCTIAGNLLGGISCYNGTITNCIVWGNSPPQIEDYGSGTSVTYSNVQGGYSGLGNIDEDPRFVDADGADDIIGTADDNLRLLPGSPCIDAGDSTAVPADTGDLDDDGNTTEQIPLDLDGRNRFADGDCDDSNVVDMGAYEFDKGGWGSVGDFDGECDVDFVDFAILAPAWLTEEGESGYNQICDISMPADNKVDWRDLDVFTDNWLAGVE